jgi:integrase
MIDKFLQEMKINGMGNKTLGNYRSILNQIDAYKTVNTYEKDDIFIESTDSHFYKAYIAFSFESGARINELLNIRVRDISETDEGMIVSIPTTKTGNDYNAKNETGRSLKNR